MTGFWKLICPLITIVTIGFSDIKANFVRRSYEIDNVTLVAYPWQAALYGYNNFYGSAMIIGEKHILTSASLIFKNGYRLNAWDISIIVGRANLDSVLGKKHGVRAVIPHPGFKNRFPYPDDVAILELRRPIRFDDTKQAIRLPEADVPTEAVVTTTGWQTQLPETVLPDLKRHYAKTMSNHDCERLLRQYYPDNNDVTNSKLLDSQVCTEPGDGNWNCQFQGNIGCPVVYNGVLVAITSSGDSCYGGQPIIHSRIYKYKDWINSTMKMLDQCHWY